MVDKIEMSLEDIIRSNRGSRANNYGGAGRRPGGGGRRNASNQGQRGFRNRPGVGGGIGGIQRGRNRGGIAKPNNYSRGDVNSTWKHDMYSEFGAKKAQGRLGTAAGVSAGVTKLLVSNLDFGVSETDVQELFSEFGALRSASVHYDRSGRSLGTADVVFERRADAVKALKQYNGVPLDGRPMNIQLATSDVSGVVRNGGDFRNGRSTGGGAAPPPPRINKGRTRGFRSNPIGGRGTRPAPPRKGGRQQRVAPTAEQLDAELDAYIKEVK